EHDVHDPDASDEQADPRDGPEYDVEGPLRRLGLPLEGEGHADGEVVEGLETPDHPFHGVRDRDDIGARGDLDDDLVELDVGALDRSGHAPGTKVTVAP